MPCGKHEQTSCPLSGRDWFGLGGGGAVLLLFLKSLLPREEFVEHSSSHMLRDSPVVKRIATFLVLVVMVEGGGPVHHDFGFFGQYHADFF